MSDSGWGLIGGDPAPGNPDAHRRVAATWDQIAQNSATAGSRLGAIDGAVDGEIWSGAAADAFHSHVRTLRPDLAAAATSYAQARAALTDHAAELEDTQAQARSALSDAETAAAAQAAANSAAAGHRDIATAQGALAVAETTAGELASAAAATQSLVGDGSGAALHQQAALDHGQRGASARATAQQAARLADAADAQARAAEQRLADARSRANRIRQQHAEAVAIVTRRLRAASDAGIPNRPLLDVLGDDIKAVAGDVARSPEFDQFLTVLSDAGDLLIDVGFVLPIAAAVGAVALSVLSGNPELAGVALEGGLAAGEGAARVFAGVGLALKGASVAGRYTQLTAGRASTGEVAADDADLALSAASVLLGGPKITADLKGVLGRNLGVVKRDLAFDNNTTLSGLPRKLLWHVPVAAKDAMPGIARQVTYVGLSGTQAVFKTMQVVSSGDKLVGDLTHYHPSGTAESIRSGVHHFVDEAVDEGLSHARELVLP